MIKKIILGALGGLLLYFPAQAQMDKGTGYLGATLSFTGGHNDFKNSTPGKQNNLSLSPSIQMGKFIKSNTMIGLGIGTNFISSTVRYDDMGADQKIQSNSNQFYLSPYIRHYKSLNEKWAIFLTSSANVTFIKTKMTREQDDYKETTSGYSVGLNVKPGIAYWITPRFSLESDINLLSLDAGYRDFSNSKTFYFRSGVTSNFNGYFSVRAAWYFQKH